ncbi:leucyl-tRNA synthetase [Halteromyces radiatus]|uniref:leucyl-tRNA synthetase n=1 Tax=Halteromyces radiatus TaxID=101107 RepID=UPI002220C6F9|nr:leucyl-tRNA synthetase [Halteromyces radiatus]KAI8083040.1 leucyl-tRNA synthetase [Halteromyces radiatus]
MATEAPKTAKRDYLRDLEGKARTLWNDNKAFEINAPTIEEHANSDDIHTVYPKFMACMPYPYMNGRLHLGHAFTFSKVDYAVGYERMKGKRALLPQGFHCTGMPIKACADKLTRELEMFGKNFERYEEMLLSNQLEEKVAVAKKSKVAAKTGNVTYQFQIMLSLGIPREEIHKFADPYYWTEYFPPQTINDMTAFGSKVDWRRCFITTDANPYYDGFVRWQMNKLRQMEKVKFGERYTIYSIVDQQPCMDHDRQSGEALNPQEYTGIKMKVLDWSKAAKEAFAPFENALKGKTVYLVAATLRPETMYGQTNCFVGTDISYGVYQVNDTEAFLVTERAARNMAFQKIFDKEGAVRKLADIKGEAVVGTKIHAPLSAYPAVYVLPMDNVLPTKGTGVVTSVPSDSPDDFATLQDLKKKSAFYKVEPEWVDFEPVPVIETPTYGQLTAPKLCELKKINSQKDRAQLAEAKELAYKEGFYLGTVITGEFKGMKVQDAKGKIREKLIESKEGFIYYEPEGLVISRSGDECVVALMDQWYLDYGETEWRTQTEKCLAGMETFTPETRHQFEQTLGWLNKWACARSFGLGTKLPWDKQFLVESLSDSTIYMAYYTVSHLLHQGSLNGTQVGPAGITAEQMTDRVWDYIFKLDTYPADEANVPLQATLDKLRREYEYFYPLDVRCSGKDLIPNHLTFFLYNHTAIFPPEMWPRAVRSNGHLMLDSKKMSKSTGNFMTMNDAVIKYGADATRFALADAGDSGEDANFEDATANAAILRLYTLLEWCEEQTKSIDTLRTGEFNFFDRIFENEMNNNVLLTDHSYKLTHYRDAMKYGVFEFQTARDNYQQACSTIGMHKDLVLRYITDQTLLIAPVCPHWAEYVWRDVLKKDGMVVDAAFPKPSAPVDEVLSLATTYIRRTIKSIRDAEANTQKKKKKSKADDVTYNPSQPKSLKIFVATKFPEWQEDCIAALKANYDQATGKFDDVKVREILGVKGILKNKKTMPFVQEQKKMVEKRGVEGFDRALLFSEVDILGHAKDEIKRNLGFNTVTILKSEDWTEEEAKQAEAAVPGQPAFAFKNE